MEIIYRSRILNTGLTFIEGIWPFETKLVFFALPQEWLEVILFDVHKCQRLIKGICIYVFIEQRFPPLN